MVPIGPRLNANTIGATGVEVSVLALGGAPLGNLFEAISDDDASGVIRSALELGIRYIDTAPHYGLGLSESRIGNAVAQWSGERPVISTKVGRLLRPNAVQNGTDIANGFAVPDALVRVSDYSASGVRRSIEESLERLGVDRIDIALVHDPEDYMDIAVRDAVPTLAALRDEGIVGAVGVGMNYSQPLARFVRECDVDVIMLAGRWTIIDRSGRSLLDECIRRNVSVVVAGPFNSGILATNTPSIKSHFDYQPAHIDIVTRAQSCATICKSFGVSLPQAALQFPLNHPAVISVVAGLRSATEVEQAVRWLQSDIPVDFWREIDQLLGREAEMS